MSKKSLTVNWYPFLSESKVIPSKSGNSCFSCVQRLIQLDTHLSGFCVLLCSFRKNMQSWSNWRHLSLWLYSPKKSWPILGWRLYQHLYRMMASSFDHWSSLPIWYFFFFALWGRQGFSINSYPPLSKHILFSCGPPVLPLWFRQTTLLLQQFNICRILLHMTSTACNPHP